MAGARLGFVFLTFARVDSLSHMHHEMAGTCSRSQDFLQASPSVEPSNASAVESKSAPSFVFVTYANEAYASGLNNLIGSVHFWEPAMPIKVYDLGLSSSTLERLRTTCNLEVIPKHDLATEDWQKDVKSFAWRAPLYKHARANFPKFFALDAGASMRAPFAKPIGKILDEEHILVMQGQDASMMGWVHDGMLHYFGLDRTTFAKKAGPSFAGGIQGHVRGYYDDIWNKYEDCLQHQECVTPPGSSLANHRQDQSALSAIIYSSDSASTIKPHTEYLAATRDQLESDHAKPSTSLIWTARGSDSEYRRYIKSAPCSV